MSDQVQEGSFVSHLTELRKRLIHSLIFIFVIFIGGYIFAENISAENIIAKKWLG